MDETKELKAAKEKLGRLEREISEHTLKLRSTESRLNAEHESLRKLVSQRTGTIAKLADANTETSQRINADVDKLDAEIRSTERRTESLHASLKAIKATMEEVTKEHEAVSQHVGQIENAKAFTEGRARIEQRFAALHEVLATARAMMAELNADAAQFGERFRGAGSTVLAPVFDDFLKDQANMEQRGFRFVFGFRQDFRIVLNPMVPR